MPHHARHVSHIRMWGLIYAVLPDNSPQNSLANSRPGTHSSFWSNIDDDTMATAALGSRRVAVRQSRIEGAELGWQTQNLTQIQTIV